MTPCEELAIQALRNVHFGMSRARVFAADMSAKSADYELSLRQRWYLWHLIWRYRRQLSSELVDLALESIAGAPIPPVARTVALGRALVSHPKVPDFAPLKRPLRFGDAEQISLVRMIERTPSLRGRYACL
jgi:hypothetical protein